MIEIPDEWNIKDAYIKEPKEKYLYLKNNNLHIIDIVKYSI